MIAFYPKVQRHLPTLVSFSIGNTAELTAPSARNAYTVCESIENQFCGQYYSTILRNATSRIPTPKPMRNLPVRKT